MTYMFGDDQSPVSVQTLVNKLIIILNSTLMPAMDAGRVLSESASDLTQLFMQDIPPFFDIIIGNEAN